MTAPVTIVYECSKCGTEVIVNSDGLKRVDPIYCCGLPLTGTSRSAADRKKKKTFRGVPGKKSDKRTLRKTDKI